MLGAVPALTESGTSRLLTHIGNNSERVQARVKASFIQGKKKRLGLRLLETGSEVELPAALLVASLTGHHCESSYSTLPSGCGRTCKLRAGLVSFWDFLYFQGWVVSKLCGAKL